MDLEDSLQNRLYRVKITSFCYFNSVLSSGVGVDMPTIDSVDKNGNVGTIPSGIKQNITHLHSMYCWKKIVGGFHVSK
ncbi:hypothetical protein [Clostridium pasteurianum]|uniref:Uncharacterized protein n=1 Tax=Clostridium pasteurianum BC1 TaxID=86416 RepID=R4K784_CLOPA|nr:hypothetical protein [Clostridium pasteurianum]AGK97551.1 hypothetical protein Clopa_2703 [Clostridium pasteurianum BC1]